MALTFHLHDHLLVFDTTGDVEFRPGLAVLRNGFAAAAARDSMVPWDLLFDIRHSSENRSTAELRLIAAQGSLLTGRCAVVAEAPLHFGLARMFGAFLESTGLVCNVFRVKDDALKWFVQQRNGVSPCSPRSRRSV